MYWTCTIAYFVTPNTELHILQWFLRDSAHEPSLHSAVETWMCTEQLSYEALACREKLL